MSVEKRILIAYATGSGSTAEVAAAIGEELSGGQVIVDVWPVKEVSQLETYHAVVLGSSIRLGRWMPEAIRFLKDHREFMANRAVAYFTTCLTMTEDTHESRQMVLSYLEPVLQLAPEIRPVGLGLFAGSLNPDLRLVMPAGPYGDFRNWEAIRGWAREIRSASTGAPICPDTLAALGGGLELHRPLLFRYRAVRFTRPLKEKSLMPPNGQPRVKT